MFQVILERPTGLIWFLKTQRSPEVAPVGGCSLRCIGFVDREFQRAKLKDVELIVWT